MYASAVRIQFIAKIFQSSSVLTLRSRPSTTFFVTLIASSSSAIRTGKLRTAIKILLLLAFAAIPEIKLNAAENPHDIKAKVIQKKS